MFGRVTMTPGHAHRFTVMVVGEHGHNERQDDDTPDAPELWSRTFLHVCKGSDKILQAGCKQAVKQVRSVSRVFFCGLSKAQCNINL